MNKPETYNKAVETIKTAILQGQMGYGACWKHAILGTPY